MPKGFFASSTLVGQAPSSRIPQCGRCGLYKLCKSPKMPPSGKGKRKVLILAEAPGKQEDEQGIQLVGESGQLLIRVLKRFGIDMREDCWLTNSVICRPPGNATPDNKKLAYCQPNLINTIEQLKPEVIIPLGGSAVKTLIKHVWKPRQVSGIGRWVGWQIPCQKINTWICPTYHPAYLLRTKDPVVEMHFAHHLRQAFKLEGRPWEGQPDYDEQVEIILEPKKVAKIIREMIKRGGTVAFDYETNRLKPDHENARIVSCSVCWRGRKTIAYPWFGEAVDATYELTQSNSPKVASNLKFEDRWTRAILGKPVKNWLWDTMLAAHVLDNREEITSIKFQSFVLLGADCYNEQVAQFLSSEQKDGTNRIDEIDLQQLLRYNALDSLLEYQVAMKQMKALNYECK